MEYDQPIFGGCVTLRNLATHREADLDGQIVLTDMPAGQYGYTATGIGETRNQMLHAGDDRATRAINGQPGAIVSTVCAGFHVVLLPPGEYVIRQISLTPTSRYLTNPSPTGLSWVPDAVVNLSAGTLTKSRAWLSSGGSWQFAVYST